MSSRRVGAPKAAAGAVRYKPSLVNTNMRGPVKIAKPDAEDHGSGSMSWWKETVGQLSPILSVISLVALYGVTFYMPFFAHQSVQFVVCASLFAISVLNFTHYLTAKTLKKITNLPALLSLKTLPRNVRKNADGSYTAIIWKPSAYTEALFLNYNPLVPVLAYIWVRSFEPFSSWLCVGLVLASGALLHLLNARLRLHIKNELLLRASEGTEGSKVLKSGEGPEAHLSPGKRYEVEENHGYSENIAREGGAMQHLREGSDLQYQNENQLVASPLRYDGPAKAVFQVPMDESITAADPINSHPGHSPHMMGGRVPERIFARDVPAAHDAHLYQLHPQQQRQNMQQAYGPGFGSPRLARNFGNDSDYTPVRGNMNLNPPQNNFNNNFNNNHQYDHYEEPAPATPGPRSFGLRFGASPAPVPQQPSTPGPFSAHVNQQGGMMPSHSAFVDEPTTPGRHKVLTIEDDDETDFSAQRYPLVPDQSPPKIVSPPRNAGNTGHAPTRFGAAATPSKPAFGAPPRFSMQDYD